jgi:multicomponent Na+:H+ antiporter subunit B
MSRTVRLAMFGLSGAGLLAVLVIGLNGLPSFGDYRGVYGLVINRTEVGLRHATDLVTAVNFDIRAFDTLGEEFILFTSVTGVVVLLRHLRSDAGIESSRGLEGHRFAGASSALRTASLVLIPLLVSLGWYTVVHGALTPGGGFQGGVILAAGPVAILLAGRYLALRRAAPEWALESLEAAGAAGYTLMGLAGLIFVSVFLKNFVALGSPGKLLSAGMIPLNSIAVGLEVTGAFLLTWTEFLDQALLVEEGELE